MLFLRKQVEDTGDSTRGVGGMDRAIHEMPRPSGMDRRLEGVNVTKLTNKNDVGVLSHGMLHADFKVFDICTNLALIDQAALTFVNEFDRVFNGQNMLRFGFV